MIASESMREMLYTNLGLVGWMFALIFNFTQYKRKKEVLSYCAQSLQNYFSKTTKNNIVMPFVVLDIFVITFITMLSTSLNNWFGDLLKTGANYFGLLFFLPILFFVFCCVIWVNPIKQLDLIVPALPLALFFARLGCFCFGCCSGKEWEYGIYSYLNQRHEIPTQLIEAFLALGLFIFLLCWRKKAKPGTMFPMYMFLYSFFRFFIEFTSSVHYKYFTFFNKYQLICLVGVLVATVQLLLMLKYGEKISTYFDENPYGFIKAIIAKIKKPKKEEIKTE